MYGVLTKVFPKWTQVVYFQTLVRLQLPESMNQAVASKIIKQKWEKSDVSVLIENSVDENNNEEYVNTIYLYS